MTKGKSFELYGNTTTVSVSSMRKRKPPLDLYVPTSLARSLVTTSTTSSKEIPSTMFLSVKHAVAPTDDARKVDLATQYFKMRASKSQNIEKWLHEWERVYKDCRKVNLPEVDGDRPVKDFVYAVESVSSSGQNTRGTNYRSLSGRRDVYLPFMILSKFIGITAV